MVAANSAVSTPMIATTVSAEGARSKITWERATIYTPAVTIVAAWMRAETGVGPAIASGSHTYKGICADLPATPTNINNVMARMTLGATVSAAAKTWSNWNERKFQNMIKAAIRKPKSPIRLTIKAFLAAFEFAHEGCPNESNSYQKPISRNEHKPTPSQPTKSIIYEAALTRIIIAAMNRLRKTKKRGNRPGSPL